MCVSAISVLRRCLILEMNILIFRANSSVHHNSSSSLAQVRDSQGLRSVRHGYLLTTVNCNLCLFTDKLDVDAHLSVATICH